MAACSLAFGVVAAARSDVDSVLGFVGLALAVGAAWGVPTLLTLLVATSWGDRRGRQRQGLPPKGRWDPVSARQTVVVDAPAAVAFARAEDAVRRISKASVTRADAATGVIEGRVGMTWHSWGERLAVRVRGKTEDQCEVEVVSEPVLRTTIADYGKNQANVNEFLEAMS